jgi:serine protease AprX
VLTAAFAAPSLAATGARDGGSWTRTGALDPGLPTIGAAMQRVVVSGATGASDAVRRAVQAVGGHIGTSLPIVDGVSATIPADQLSKLSSQPGVTAVTMDRSAKLYSASWDDSTSASSYVWSSGAGGALQAGNNGAGVSVAVLDTGVSRVNDLAGNAADGQPRLVNGPDLSGENKNDVDSYGHGTVMAGIVAGSGVDGGSAPKTGVAPGARIVSVKVAGYNGVTDVSTVLAAMNWVASFKDTYNIKVVSLSWGVPSTQSVTVDPLNYAVERLWTSGVTVVVAAGNNGPNPGTITKPGDDPLVITAGAYDDRGDLNTSNDIVPGWSSQGAVGQGKPDLVSPGRTIVATRSPNSYIEVNNPKSLIAPSLTPDQVKAALVSTASPIGSIASTLQGAGRIQYGAALAKDVSAVVAKPMVATGLGTLNGSRGGAYVTTKCNGVDKVLNDETTSWCTAWDGSAWTGSAWTGSAWTGSAWTGSAWTGSAWTGSAWTGSAWTGSAWTGSAWTGSAWTGSAWTGSAWTGMNFTGSAWTGSAWTSAVYEDASTTFLDAFWGNHPKWYEHVAGETSDAPPWAGIPGGAPRFASMN